MDVGNKQRLSFPIFLIYRGGDEEQGCCVGGVGGGERDLARRQQLYIRQRKCRTESKHWLSTSPPPSYPKYYFSFSLYSFCLSIPYLQYPKCPTWRTFLSRPVFCESILSSLESGFWLIWKWPFMIRSWWCLNDVRARFVFAWPTPCASMPGG